MADYCTVTEIKADMPESGIAATSDYDAAITQMITDASRLIDNEIGKWPNYFSPSTDDETRYYDGAEAESGVLCIDDCAAITTVSVSQSGGIASSDYTAWSSTDFMVEPYNYVALDVPIRRIRIDFINGSQSSYYGYRKGVRVVGRFGWSTSTPAPIARACKIQTIRWFMRGKQAFQDAGMNAETGQMTYVKKLDPDVAELLKPYILNNLA